MVDVGTEVNENQQSRDMAELSYNVNTIFHPVDAAGRAMITFPPVNLIYSYVHDLHALQTSSSAATTLERWIGRRLSHTSMINAQNKRMS